MIKNLCHFDILMITINNLLQKCVSPSRGLGEVPASRATLLIRKVASWQWQTISLQVTVNKRREWLAIHTTNLAFQV